ncbi:MAG: carbohydrate-binding protein [Verrucomicrobiales bacterium]|nr:carbohydrate-binding protein [Verrucomicrobiales bacterium]
MKAADIGAFESSFIEIAPAFLLQPQSKTNTEGQSVSFTAKVTGTAPFSYQWFRNGDPISEATNISLLINPTSTNDAGSYFVVVTNTSGAATSAIARLTVNVDNLPPTIKTIFPILNGVYTNQITNSILTARGTALDNTRVEHVLFTFNNTNWQDAILNTNSPSISWTVDAPASPGSNIFTVKAVDFHGRESAVAVIKFFYNVPELFTLSTNGSGAIKGIPGYFGTPTNEALLFVGRPYTLSATPAVNWVLTNWTDGLGNIVATNTPTLSFIMRSNLALNANFITNPLVRFGGSYNGLFLPEDVTTAARHNAGFLNMTVAPTFAYSGKVLVDGDALLFTGKLRLDGSSSTTVLRTKQQKLPLTLSFTLDFEGGSDALTGSIAESNNWSSPLLANRTVWATNNLATSLTNYLTMLFPGPSDGTGPSGIGFGAVTINALGSLSLSGALADGRAIAQTIPISKTGQWPVYTALLPLPKVVTNGSVLVTNLEFQEFFFGWVDVAGEQPTGTLTWLRSGVPDDLFAAGFTNQFSVAGSLYHPPRAGVRALAITNAMVTLSGGNFPEPIGRSFTWTTNNVFVFPPTNSPPKIALALRYGTFTGTFTNPVQTNMTLKISGAILQNSNFGGGLLIGTNFAGRVEITPQ